MHQDKSRLAKVTLFLFLILVFAFAAPRIVQSINYADSDFFSFWLAARMTWDEQSSYDSALWIEGHMTHGAGWISDNTFLYPLPLSLILAPLGLLPLLDAYTLWVFLSIAAIFGSLLLIQRIWKDQSMALREMIPIFLGALLFRPVLVTVRNGQLGGFLLLLLVLVLYLWEREQWLSGGMIFALILLKPNVGVPISVFVMLWAILSKRWKIPIAFGLGGIFIFAMGQLQDPSWLGEYLRIAGAKGDATLGFAPSLWGLSSLACQADRTCVLILGLLSANLILLILLAVFIRFRHSLRPRIALSLVVAAALFVTPYLWAYDQILLLVPVVVLSVEMIRRGYPYLASAPLVIYASLGAILLVFGAIALGKDVLSAALSLVILLGLLLFQRIRAPDGWSIAPQR